MVDAVVYVVDSADVDRLNLAKVELAAILKVSFFTCTYSQEDELKGVSLLVFANKQDLPGALNGAKISEALGLTEIRDRKWTLFESSATNGKGLTDGFDWLADELCAETK